ncbi:MAG TPA: hypothetical protein PKA05_14270 [Roseiflexaceae bacterium]|nr:hypothetical protein [Roseiflexaceae bacterium]HMP41541.1 hypothetical protein [Roseiflexaceae bacterium]
MASSAYQHEHDPHPWMQLPPDEVIEQILHELYAPVSALGSQFERINAEQFADDELPEVLAQIHERVNDLGRLVVLLKRYSEERRHLRADHAMHPPAEEAR